MLILQNSRFCDSVVFLDWITVQKKQMTLTAQRWEATLLTGEERRNKRTVRTEKYDVGEKGGFHC